MKYALMLALLGTIVMTGCTQPQSAERILTQQGYTHIEMTGWRPFSCGHDDSFATGFKAQTVNGSQVTGVVCEGLIFKASTIRLD